MKVTSGGNTGGTAVYDGNPNSDTITVTINSGQGGVVTFNSSAFGGNIPVTVSQNGTGTFAGIGAQNLSGAFTSGGSLHTLNIQDISGATNLNYQNLGFWNINDNNGNLVEEGVYNFGSQTPTASMPTTGTGSYTGNTAGIAVMNNGTNTVYQIGGTATLNANFGTNSISGTLSNLNAYTVGNSSTLAGTINNINLNAGSISGNAFIGSAAASSTAGTAANISGASGNYRGNFYGPAANEVGGTYYVTGPGSTIVTGTFGAHH